MMKDTHGSARFGLIAAAVLLASLACAKVAQCVMEPKRVQGIAAYAAAQSEPDPNRAAPFLENVKTLATALKEKNLFMTPPAKEHPVKQVDGILGSEILVGDKWYKAGDTIGDAKIVAIEPTQVTIEWDGQTKAFAPLSAASNKSAGLSKEPVEKPEETKAPAPEPTVKTEMAEVTVTATPVEEDPLAWLGVDLPPGLRAKLLEKWNSASEEERQQAQEQWNRMSDSEKEEALRGLAEER